MSAQNGGAAFPSPGVVLATGQQGAYEGMTMHDYYAGLAMQAAITGHISFHGHDNFWPSRELASYAREVADAMIAERAK